MGSPISHVKFVSNRSFNKVIKNLASLAKPMIRNYVGLASFQLAMRHYKIGQVYADGEARQVLDRTDLTEAFRAKMRAHPIGINISDTFGEHGIRALIFKKAIFFLGAQSNIKLFDEYIPENAEGSTTAAGKKPAGFKVKIVGLDNLYEQMEASQHSNIKVGQMSLAKPIEDVRIRFGKDGSSYTACATIAFACNTELEALVSSKLIGLVKTAFIAEQKGKNIFIYDQKGDLEYDIAFGNLLKDHRLTVSAGEDSHGNAPQRSLGSKEDFRDDLIRLTDLLRLIVNSLHDIIGKEAPHATLEIRAPFLSIRPGIFRKEDPLAKNASLEQLLSKDKTERIKAVKKLGMIHDNNPRILQLLVNVMSGDINPEVRAVATEYAGKVGIVRILYPLVNALGDEAYTVVTKALNSLKALGKRANNEAVKNALFYGLNHANPRVKIGSAVVLAEIERDYSESSMIALIKVLSDPNENVRCAAATTLARIGDIRAVNPLLKASKEEIVKQAITVGLKKNKQKKDELVQEFIAFGLDHSDIEIQQATLEILENLEG